MAWTTARSRVKEPKLSQLLPANRLVADTHEKGALADGAPFFLFLT